MNFIINNDMKFYIGKYNGEMVDDVFQKDINYCSWFVRTFPNSKTSTYIQSKNVPMRLRRDYIFWFGKHRGKKIIDILDQDFSYCKWFVETYPVKNETMFIIQTKKYIDYINKPQ
jgi:uncharacterized protein (DUF3820 family)